MPTLHSYALITVGELKSIMGISSSTHDDRLTLLINQATDAIEGYCQRRFKSTTYTNEKYNGDGTKSLFLNQFPIITFTILEFNNTYNNSSSWETVNSEDYWKDDASGVLTKVSKFSRGTQNYRVTYEAGYSTIPSDLQYACAVMASEAFAQVPSAGVKSETLGDHTVTFQSIMETNPILLNILARYRKITTAPNTDEPPYPFDDEDC